MADTTPVLKISKGYTMFDHTFLKWTFFYRNPMPWRFARLMNLPNIYEFFPVYRNWLCCYPDVPVIFYNQNVNSTIAYTYELDYYVWPQIKPMLQRGTYHYKNKCNVVYAAEN